MTEENALNKVRKLLALAGNNPNQQESEAAMMMAQKLMCKHGLEMRDVEDKDRDRPGAVELSHEGMGKTASWWEGRIAMVVAENFKCGVYRRSSGHSSSGRVRRKITFVGFPEDAEIAVQVYDLAVRTCKYEADKYVSEAKEATILVAQLRNETCEWDRARSKRTRNDYINGWIEGIRQAFKKNVTDNALIVVKPDAVIQRMKNLGLVKSRTTGGRGRGDGAARAAGKRDGSQFTSREKLH